MPLRPGKRLGPYELVAPLGAGGMGEVYRAKDTRLNRDAAFSSSNLPKSSRAGSP
jgi:serine/threonine protein kinase